MPCVAKKFEAQRPGLSHARILMEKVKSGEAGYHFIEIMCCPGGCIGGGGQPIPTNGEIRKQRMEGLYAGDSAMKLRSYVEHAESRATPEFAAYS